MMQPTSGPANGDIRGGDEEALLARCIERYPEVGPAVVDEVALGDPERAARLRSRLAALERLGLLVGRGQRPAPTRIGPYEILDLLGEGGMGAVYLARDERSGERVALKIGHAHRGSGPATEAGERARARFEREIRAVRQLEHPGIVPIREVGDSDGQPYFAMELVEGATLERIVAELRTRQVEFDRLSTEVLREIVRSAAPAAREDEPGHPAASSFGATYVETVCRWIAEIADALAHAHAHAIVHRDVKPSNVLVGRDGRARLFDLGLARVEREPSLTRSGDLAGSPYYMSPEQVSGPHERVDRRTDVYSLGVTLYELLTLRRPFEGPTSAQVFRQILGREPLAPRRTNPLVPRDLETICLAALEKDPRRRYASMEDFAGDLRRFLAFQPVRARPPGPGRRVARFARRNPAAASAIFLGALVLLGLPLGLLAANAAVRAEERKAALEARLKSRVTEFLVDQFELTEGEHDLGATISARELLDRSVERLEGSFEDDPLVRAELFAATGTVYENLGLHERAIPLLDRALAIRQSQPEADPAALVPLLDALAGAHLAARDPRTARRLCERGLDLLAATAGKGGLEAVPLRRTLARAAAATGDAVEAERSLSIALGILREHGNQRGEDVADVLEELGTTARERGDLAPARERLLEALAIRRRAWSPDMARIARATEELARVEEARGEVELATAARRELARYRSVGADPPPPLPPFDRRAGAGAEYERSFQIGITALQARELDRAILAFERCLELDSTRSVCAYNLACGYALSGDVERGLAWLSRATDMGFGVAEYRLRVATSDPEIAVLREDPRGAALVARMRENAERVRALVGSPSVVLPPGAGRKGPMPLLVVLHGEAGSQLDVVDGPWRAIAAELGAALVAPSGSVPTSMEPVRGFAWFEDPADLVRRHHECERGIDEAVRAFLADQEVDRERVFVAGEGYGATVAFDVALRAPGLFRGVLMVDGPIHPDTPLHLARRAAALGLRTALLSFEGAPKAPTEASSKGSDARRWLEACGFSAPVVHADPGATSTDRSNRLRQTLESWFR